MDFAGFGGGLNRLINQMRYTISPNYFRLFPLTIIMQGVPFDIDDAMFNPPMPRLTSEYSLDPNVYPNQPYQQHHSPVLEHQEVPLVSSYLLSIR